MAEKPAIQVKVRTPTALHRKLMREADRKGQTLNAEILQRLEGSFEVMQTLETIEKQMKKTADAMAQALTSIQGAAEADKILASEPARPSNAELQRLKEHYDKVGGFLNKHSTAKSGGNDND